jgi:hypothetical protein
MVHVGLLHHAKELPGIGGERFHVPALAFRVEGIESERGFAGTADSGNHDKLVAGDRDIDIFKVVLAGTFDDDIFHAYVLRLFSFGI